MANYNHAPLDNLYFHLKPHGWLSLNRNISAQLVRVCIVPHSISWFVFIDSYSGFQVSSHRNLHFGGNFETHVKYTLKSAI